MKKKETFGVYIVDQENATWQGQVTWLDKRETKSFRSMLELIRLLEGAVNGEGEEKGTARICEHSYVPLALCPGRLIG